MKIVILGASGQIGTWVTRHWVRLGHTVTVVNRSLPRGTERIGDVQYLTWDGATVGPWAAALEGAQVVLNLAGRSVNCRYTRANLNEILSSRVRSTRALGLALERCAQPPPLWLQMSTATIYAHSYDRANDEETGLIAGNETDVPRYWDFSLAVARAWEAEVWQARTPFTRRVVLRTAMVMTPSEGGVFAQLRSLAQKGLGGPHGDGRQYLSWIHGEDFCRALDHIIGHSEIAGPVNLAAPAPLPNAEFQAQLCEALGAKLALPSPRWLLEVGAFFMRTDTELLLKSRRVVSTRLPRTGFRFAYPTWAEACADLVKSAEKLTAENHRRTLSPT